MNRRRQAIVLLAGSLLDGLWFPARPSGASGLSGGRRVPCPSCSKGDDRGPGWITDRWRRRVPCETCGGGEDERGVPQKGLGFVTVDDYDRERRPIRTEETPDAPPPMVSKRCDSCAGEGVFGNGRRCQWCGGAGYRSWPRETPEPDAFRGEPGMAVLAAIDRRDKAGDYAALEKALGELRAHDVLAWRLWVRRYVTGDERFDGTVGSERAWAFIDARMPELIRVPSSVRNAERARRRHLETLKGRHVDKRARADRDQEIRRRFERGEATVEELVRTFGLSRSTIYDAIHGPRG